MDANLSEKDTTKLISIISTEEFDGIKTLNLVDIRIENPHLQAFLKAIDECKCNLKQYFMIY